MVYKKNKLKNLLKQGKGTLGTHLTCTWPSLWEIAGNSGLFDYIELTSQYGPYDLYDLDNICRAAELTGVVPVIKLDQQPRVFLAQRAISAGFGGILFADVRTVEDTEECVRAIKLDPVGLNGANGGRATSYGYRMGSRVPRDEVVERVNDVVIMLMIEKKQAIENLDAILSINGIDMVQFGPADYGISIGHPGEGYSNKEIRDAHLRTIETALNMGIRPRVELGTANAEAIQNYLDLGVRDFCIGWETGILANWYQENGKAIRNLVEDL
jgi:4-hydroxy-2-oxoheptanedioate aldolase